MKFRTSYKKNFLNIYLFLITIVLIALITGGCFYKVENRTSDSYIKEKVDINEYFNTRISHFKKTFIVSVEFLLCSILVFPIIMNVLKLFYEAFAIGFLFSYLLSYSFKGAFFYTFFVFVVPLLFNIIQVKISLSIFKKIIKLIVHREGRVIFLKKLILKYLVITFLLFCYQFLIFMFSGFINSIFLSFIN